MPKDPPTIKGVKHWRGCVPDTPDSRDYRYTAHPLVAVAVPAYVDLRKYDTPIFTQLMQDCSANAALGMFRWLQNYQTNSFFFDSRRFEYKVGRNLAGETGDVGLSVRNAVKAMNQYGVCHELIWPDDVANFDVEPSAAAYVDALSSRATSYWRADVAGNPTQTLINLKTLLASNLVVQFATAAPDSFDNPDPLGRIPMPSGTPMYHSMVFVGYDDDFTNINGSKGCLICRNSWGPGWGLAGYCLLPYAYITTIDAVYGTDDGTLVNDCWVVAAESELPAPGPTPTPTPGPFTGVGAKVTINVQVREYQGALE